MYQIHVVYHNYAQCVQCFDSISQFVDLCLHSVNQCGPVEKDVAHP